MRWMKEADNVELELLNLSNEVLLELVEEKDVAGIWVKLETLYQ